MGKGDDTRARVLAQGLDIASEWGLESLTIGALADRAGLSKSGLYAHFTSKEDMQCQVLDAAADAFAAEVMLPAIALPRGLPRVEEIQERWMHWVTDLLPGGCPLIAASLAYDDREGPVRDRAVHHIERMVGAVERAATIAVDERHFARDLDTAAYAFEVWAIVMAYHQYSRLLRRPDAADLARRSFASLNARAAG
ncbi:TetR/AcrR family transcriptional regulator [Demequina sp. SO4-18]|uniref:TetR/AcrR family transcriptional regulator n=1 Tax=Demequina sp. SO4-18 TaxID=3401026 RepID=UPI003B596C83